MGEYYFDGRVRRIPTQTFEDRRGRLSPIGFDFGDGGFRPLRAFIVEGHPGAVRGCHGHATTRHVLMLVSGLVEVELHWRGRSERLRLDPAARAILIEPPVWSSQTFLAPNSAIVVFCNTPYDAADYIEDAAAVASSVR